MRRNLTCWLWAGCCVLLMGACSDDDDGGSCGDGVVQAGESCDGAALADQDCTTVAGNFTGGTLGCSASCTFDTSACTAPAAGCGNGAIDDGEDCDGALLGGVSCETVPGGNFSGGELACTAGCSFDTAGCTAAPEDCGNGTIDSGEDCDGEALGGVTCATLPGGGYNEGELACTAGCSFDTAGCTAAGDPSAQIQAVLDATEGEGLSLPVNGALVTYTKMALGNDAAGFFLQAEQAGPALFVAVDPATLSPAPAAGDAVALTVTAVATAAGLAQATAVSNYSRLSSGNDLAVLAQDLTDAADLVSSLDSYAAELINLSGTISGQFFFGGLDHATAVIETAGVTEENNLRLRLPETVRASLGLGPLCSFTVTRTPLWRHNDIAQVSAWLETEISAVDCPTSEIACDNNLDEDQDGYTDCLDSECSGDAACAFADKLYLWELDSDQTGSDAGEFVEIYNNTGAAVDFGAGKTFLLLVNGSNERVYYALQLTGSLAAGEVHLVGNSGVVGVDQVIPGGEMQNGPDGALLVRCDGCTDAASDFPSSFTMVAGPTFATAGGATATKIDALAYDTGDDDDADLMSVLDVTVQFDEDAAGAATTESLQRVSPASWAPMTPSPGEAGWQ